MSRLFLAASERELSKMARTAPERSKFFVRPNYAVGVKPKPERGTVEKDATYGLLILAEQAIGGIEQGVQAESALRELWAALLELKRPRAGDPGVRVAAQDLYEAAAAVALQKRAGADFVDLRLWRLLKQ